MLAVSVQVKAVNLALMRPVKFTQVVGARFHDWMQIQSSHEQLELFDFTGWKPEI